MEMEEVTKTAKGCLKRQKLPEKLASNLPTHHTRAKLLSQHGAVFVCVLDFSKQATSGWHQHGDNDMLLKKMS